MPEKTYKPVPLSAGGAVDAAALVNTLLAEVGAWVKVVNEERTKRARIATWEAVTCENLQGRREFLLTYLEETFAERREYFRALFAALDKAIGASAPEELGMIVGLIESLAKHSPLTDLAQVAEAFKDPNFEIAV